jgi:D-glycero-D-manno-heptose 1,7-bisphosphate phosphatase
VFAHRGGVFLDRDGVLNHSPVRDGRPGSPSGLEDIEVLPGVEQACEKLRAAGFVLVVVTNQPEIARGTLTAEVVDGINRYLGEKLPLDDIVVCPHDDVDGCECRKPKPGMLVDAARRHGLKLRASYMVGDRWRDIEAGRRAGCRTIFVDRGYSERVPEQPDAVVGDLGEGAAWILDRVGRAEL